MYAFFLGPRCSASSWGLQQIVPEMGVEFSSSIVNQWETKKTVWT